MVQRLFEAELPHLPVLGVFRVENSTQEAVYGAVRCSMAAESGAGEATLWHGTSVECVQNIVLNGFNRAYCGRHGTKLGSGTYFSATAAYSARFCDRKRPRKFMILAKVLTGAWVKGSAGLVEPPFKDAEDMVRYDSTVDDEET